LTSSRFFVIFIALGVPLEIFALLPSSYRGHQRVAQIVFAMGRVLDVGPLELGAAAARKERQLAYIIQNKGKRDSPAAFFPNTSNQIHVVVMKESNRSKPG
jgi:hypothetical protein